MADFSGDSGLASYNQFSSSTIEPFGISGIGFLQDGYVLPVAQSTVSKH